MGTLIVYDAATDETVHVKSQIKNPLKFADVFARVVRRYPNRTLAYKTLKKDLTYHAFCAKYQMLSGEITTKVLSAAEQQEKAIAQLAAYRWKKETGGTAWNGYQVHTDRAARAVGMAEIMNINAGLRTDGEPWKFADGVFRTLTNNEFIEMYAIVGAFVRLCFACEALCQTRIAAGEYDIETIWAEEWATLTAE